MRKERKCYLLTYVYWYCNFHASHIYMTSLISRHYIFYNNVTSVTVIVQQFLVLDIIFFGQCEFLCVSEDNLFVFQLANHKVFYLVNFSLLKCKKYSSVICSGALVQATHT